LTHYSHVVYSSNINEACIGEFPCVAFMGISRGKEQVKKAIFLLLMLLGSVAYGDAIYTDEASFVSMLAPDYYNEVFAGWTWGNPLDSSQLTWDSPVVNGYSWTASSEDGLWSYVGALSTNNNKPLIFTFTGAPVTAVGGYFASTDVNGDVIAQDLIVMLSNGTIETINGTAFRGFTTDKPISSISFIPIQTPFANYPKIDFYVGTAVPEPTTMALMLAGLAGLGIARRRSK